MFWTPKESGYLTEPIGVKDDLRRSVKNFQNSQKVILKGDRSLDALFSRLYEKFKVFRTPKESGYRMEPIGVNDDLRRGIQNVQNGQKGDSERRQES